MTRKDSEKDSERPHYYSQFWLDIAAGRRIIGAPKPNEEEDSADEALEPLPQRRGHANEAMADGRGENIVHPVAEPIETSSQEFIEPESDEFDLATNNTSNMDYDTQIDDADIPDMDLDSDEEAEEDYYEEEGEEEEEEDGDMNWGRGRKKAKPIRPVKPGVKKSSKRDPRRGY